MLNNALQGLPFPFRVQSTNPYNLILESRTPLFDAPKYSGRNDSFWPKIEGDGWRTCELGYSVYSRRIPGFPNHLLVLHGLKIKGEWRSQGRDENLSMVLPRERVISYVDNLLSSVSDLLLETENKVESKVRSLVTDGTHEIRSMSSSLYHAAYELLEQLKHEPSHKLALAKNVVALSELISARIELADIVASEREGVLEQPSLPIIVWKKFEKIAKCYIAYAKRRDITIQILGSSRGHTKGISNFEMIPLVVVENAVKYSPNKTQVIISFSETPTEIICSIESLGPKIEEIEKGKIFEREYRGTHAESSGKTGSGIGLYFASRLLSYINGSISVSQSENPHKSHGKYYTTIFELRFTKI